MAQRTKNAIRQSFMELLAERPFDKITIGDIAQRSEITRNAFYYYYQDIYALVEDIFALELERFAQQAASYTSWQDAFRVAITFALDNRRAVLHIYQSSSRETLERYYRQTILTAITDFVHMMAPGPGRAGGQDHGPLPLLRRRPGGAHQPVAPGRHDRGPGPLPRGPGGAAGRQHSPRPGALRPEGKLNRYPPGGSRMGAAFLSAGESFMGPGTGIGNGNGEMINF